MNTSDFKSFHYLESGEITFSLFSTIKSVSKLDPGSYKVDYVGYPRDTVTLHKDPNTETSKSPEFFSRKSELDEFMRVFCDKSVYYAITKVGFYHKAGILLHGVEGGGKTSIVKYYCTDLINNNDAIVMHIDNITRLENIWDFVVKVRQIQDNLIIIVFDEIDKYFNVNGHEALLKSIIDGNKSITNCIFFAMTNYIDNIPDAVKNRPSRFKYCIEVGSINDVVRIESIVTPIVSDYMTKDEITIFVKELKGSTLDTIKQACINRIMKIKGLEVKKQRIGFEFNF